MSFCANSEAILMTYRFSLFNHFFFKKDKPLVFTLNPLNIFNFPISMPSKTSSRAIKNPHFLGFDFPYPPP